MVDFVFSFLTEWLKLFLKHNVRLFDLVENTEEVAEFSLIKKMKLMLILHILES